MARRVCSGFLQVLRSYQAEQGEEKPTPRTPSQQIRGAQFVAYIPTETTPQELKPFFFSFNFSYCVAYNKNKLALIDAQYNDFLNCEIWATCLNDKWFFGIPANSLRLNCRDSGRSLKFKFFKLTGLINMKCVLVLRVKEYFTFEVN